MMDLSNDVELELELEGNKKLKSVINNDNSLAQNVDTISPGPPAPASKLSEQEMLLIFANSCISTKDLFNFRCISKIWRDAATTIMLQRDAAYVVLDMTNLHSQDIPTELGKLISNSPKFPTSHLRICSSRFDLMDYADYPDLKLFFKRHGKKFKTLCPHGCTSLQQLLDILFIYTPKLECLDLSQTALTNSDTNNENKSELTSKWASEVLSLKCLILGHRLKTSTKITRQVIHLLLSSLSSNLSSIENVNLLSLPHILDEVEGHLIKSFEYDSAHDDPRNSMSVMQLFSSINPKLTKLVLRMENPFIYPSALPWIEKLMESSKETLEILEIAINPLDYQHKLMIPSMKNLKSITLDGKLFYPILNETVVKGENSNLFTFQDHIFSAEKYFPTLEKVILKNQELNDRHEKENLLCFFNRHSNQDGGSSNDINNFRSVKILQIYKSSLPQMSGSRLLPKTFPNITIFKVSWFFGIFNSSLWALCPLSELVEIYDISMMKELDSSDEDMTPFIDTFFTGFPLGLCMKLQIEDFPQHIMDDPESLDFLRIYPSVCDLKHLKELKLKFSKRSLAQFASRVTGLYAFSRMPNTKFIISYDPCCITKTHFGKFYAGTDGADNVEIVKSYDDQELCFTSIKPYVQIVQETQKLDHYF